MNTCSTCHYWHKEYKIKNNVSDCDRPNSLPELRNNETFYINATASDESGLNAVLMTGKDFGCIHHRTKQELIKTRL